MGFLSQEFGWDSGDETRFLDSILAGRTNLVLGAGASLGETGGDGRRLPSAPCLAAELIAAFDLVDLFAAEEERSKKDLALVYNTVKRQCDGTLKLSDYFYRRFLGCSSSWQQKFLEFPWRRIWTFNVDDVIECAAEKLNLNLEVFDWQQELRPKTRDTQLIHLHGRVRKTLKLGEVDLGSVIFSMQEYIHAAKSATPWHTEFRSSFIQHPTIVCGARMVDEYDFADTIAAGNQSYDAEKIPSALVIPEVTPLFKARAENAGLRLVTLKGSEFFQKLSIDLSARHRVLELNERSSSVFSSQFRRLRVLDDNLRSNADFFAGFAPDWFHVASNFDATRQKIQNIPTDDRNVLPTARVRAFIFEGKLGNGKSTGLLQFAKMRLAAGYDFFLFRNEEAPDLPAIFQHLGVWAAETKSHFSNSF